MTTGGRAVGDAAGSAPPPAPPPWRQAAVLARGTWRLAWREPLTRLLLALAVLLAVVGCVAAIGSPTAGDGAVQMLAVCLQVVPFALVLLAGDIWRRDADEAAVFARPVDALTHAAGRALGLCAVGLGLLAAVAAVSVLGLWAIARLPLGGDLAWIGLFSAVDVAPGFVLLTGACFWWLASGGAGPRYHAAVILGALLVAFYSYRLNALAAHSALRGLAFFAPFPGLLTLGLALPPAALGAGPVPGWLWLNRAFFLLAGIGLLALGARRRGAGLRLSPLRDARVWRALFAATVVAAVAAGVALGALGRRLAPPLLAAAPALAGVTVPAAERLDLRLAVDAASGRLSGSATWNLARPARSVYLLLNAGLRLQPPPGAVLTEPAGRGLVPGTSARLYRIRLPAAVRVLRLGFGGRLLPVPSSLPYPPFPLGQPLEGAAAGARRVFLDGRGTWYPLPVGAGLVPASAAATDLTLRVVGGAGGWWGLPARRSGGALRLAWSGRRLPAVIGELAPLRVFSGTGWTLAAAGPPSRGEAGVLATYAAAEVTLHRVDPALFPAGALRVVAAPLLTRPLLADGALWLPADVPYCTPVDPVAGTCAGGAPTRTSAALLLSDLGWAQRLGAVADGLALPWPAAAAGAAWSVAPRAAVTAWAALGGSGAVSAGWTRGAPLPWLGTLTPAQRALAARVAPSA